MAGFAPPTFAAIRYLVCMTPTITDLRNGHCAPTASRMDDQQIRALLLQLPGWELSNNEIAKTYKFKNYYETLAFVNATAWISHREDHHPDLEVGYNQCKVRYSTHSAGGISQNDLICAAKVDGLIASA